MIKLCETWPQKCHISIDAVGNIPFYGTDLCQKCLYPGGFIVQLMPYGKHGDLGIKWNSLIYGNSFRKASAIWHSIHLIIYHNQWVNIALQRVNTVRNVWPHRVAAKEEYSISQEICTRFCCALLCCGYAIVHNEFTWSIYPYSSGLLCWHWGNR